MKHSAYFIAMTMMAVAMLGLTSCGKDNNNQTDAPTPQPDPQVLTTLNGTGWVGTKTSSISDPMMGILPVDLMWTIDFTSEKAGEMLLEWTVGGMQQDAYPSNFTYSYDGTTHDGLFVWEEDTTAFHVDIYSRTFQLDIGFSTAAEGAEDEAAEYVGGVTTFTQVR